MELFHHTVIYQIEYLTISNLEDDLKEKATEALHQGEKVKVCENKY